MQILTEHLSTLESLKVLFLAPMLFLLYINDIVENINSSIRLFADDTSLYIIVDNPVEAANQLSSDLSKIHQWATKMVS